MSQQGRCIANETCFIFVSSFSLSFFFLLAAAVSAGLRRVFCRKQTQPVRTSGIRDTFPIFHRLVCVILLDNSSMRDRRLYSSASGIHPLFIPHCCFISFFTRSLYIIAHARNGVRLVNRNRGVSKVSNAVKHFCFQREKKHAFCGLLVPCILIRDYY